MAALRFSDGGSRNSSDNHWSRDRSKHDGKRDKVDVRDHGYASSGACIDRTVRSSFSALIDESQLTEPFGHSFLIGSRAPDWGGDAERTSQRAPGRCLRLQLGARERGVMRRAQLAAPSKQPPHRAVRTRSVTCASVGCGQYRRASAATTSETIPPKNRQRT